MMKRFSFFYTLVSLLLLLSLGPVAHAQAPERPEVYPQHWWAGMKHNTIQLMVYGKNMGRYAQVSTTYAGVKVLSVKKTESPNYLLVDLNIAATTKPGKCPLVFSAAGAPSFTMAYSIKARRPGRGSQFAQGINSQDFVYLIMPDRFANGDANNDVVKGYKDEVADRSNPSAHHGGDMQGIVNNLDYLKDLGVTSVWMCPVTENDMPWQQESAGAISGYHGYWFTNHFRIDKRYGGEAAYIKLSDALHSKGMKLIQDAVYNHVGNAHFLYADKPFADMFNRWENYTGSNHREEAVYSPYASADNKKVMLDGWFVPHLPDVNQRHPVMAKYLIQYAIWNTEEFGIDGWRVDTYKYCDEQFMNNVNTALLTEYPTLTVFGEAWCNTVPGSAYFTRNNMKVPFKHNAQGTTDFPMQAGMLAAINQPFGWMEGANKLYNTLSQDGLYEDPKGNCIFLDNHDVDRYLTMIGGDPKKYYMGLGLLLTMRGIPQLYYGTEVLMKNDEVSGDGKKRNDFPGGFAGDALNKFTEAGRSAEENKAFNYIKALAQFRRQSKALGIGQTTDYLPTNGLYVYFRQHGKESVMCILNSSTEERTVEPTQYAQTAGYKQAREVGHNQNLTMPGSWKIPAQTMWVVELK